MTLASSRRCIEILLVEDSPTDRLIALEALQQARIVNTPHVVENGVEAMAYLRREGKYASARRPDLILLDLNLPKKDGREVLLEIKNDPLLKFIPVIVLTTSSAEEDVARAYGDHANSYITKPVDFPRFTQALEAIGTYWFEVVTLPPEATVQRLVRNDRPRPSSPPPSGQRQLDVVLVSDEVADAHSLGELLAESPVARCDLTQVDSLQALRRRLDARRCDALLVDLLLGDSVGLETYRAVRATAPDTPIILLLGDAEKSTGELALREGADDYLCEEDRSAAALLRSMRYAISRKSMQAQLRRAQRMEAIGLLASGIAHDFNNLLTVLHGHAELLSELQMTSAAHESVLGIEGACERAAQLTRQLLTFSQRQTSHMTAVDLNRVVGDFAKMLRRVLGGDVTLALGLAGKPLDVCADIGMLEQVLLNLAINARDAMPTGGELALQTSEQVIDAGAVPHPDAYPGEFACLVVRDTGSGIPPDILNRIWEPFVTTKESGRGTGLGLSMVQSIVQQHRGWIQVESELGIGTRFQIWLPRAEASEARTSERMADKPRRGTETILLADDEAPVRQLVRTVLLRQGYRVLEARSGPDAVAVYEEATGRVDLLLTDLMMPGGMTGRQLAQELRQKDSTLKVIYTSGFGIEFVSSDFAVNEGVDFLAKPYVLSRLLGTVRRALDEAPAS